MMTLLAPLQLSICHILSITMLAFVAAACGAIYKPSPFWGASGYSSKDIDATTVTVNYLTGATADENTAKNYALYRCAEITLERGYDSFVVLKGGAFSTGSPYGYTTSSTITMRMLNGIPGKRQQYYKNSEGSYVAKDIKAQLEPRIKR